MSEYMNRFTVPWETKLEGYHVDSGVEQVYFDSPVELRAGKKYLTITVDGKVLLCEVLAEAELPK